VTLTSEPVLALLGLGEAGRTFAVHLAGSATVSGWDPVDSPDLPGVTAADSATACVEGADAVLAFTPAEHCDEALESVAAALPPTTVYADFATTAPDHKRRLAARAETSRLRFVDAAIMAPVRRGADRAPVLLAGDAATELAGLLSSCGLDVEVVDGPPGSASAHKLLRSLLVKGLTAVMIESLRAAEREQLLDWFADHLVESLTALDAATLSSFLNGTLTHSVRRVEEMEAAATMVEEAGGSAPIARAVADVLRSVPAEGIPTAGRLR
jgi:3-hydroxyisobutyrate dehydrogenase-like beta-hydroxyacid dehydrogenase